MFIKDIVNVECDVIASVLVDLKTLDEQSHNCNMGKSVLVLQESHTSKKEK